MLVRGAMVSVVLAAALGRASDGFDSGLIPPELILRRAVVGAVASAKNGRAAS